MVQHPQQHVAHDAHALARVHHEQHAAGDDASSPVHSLTSP